MVPTEQQAPGRATLAQRWLACLALVAAAGAVLVPLAAIGFRASVALVGAGLVGMGLAAAGVWWALTHKGLVRGLAIALVVAAPVTTLVLYTRAGLTWVVLVALAVLGVAVAAGRAALARDPAPGRMREHEAPPPRRPYLIMNPRSGGGRWARFGLKDKAEAHGATVALLEGPEIIDVGQLAREAVANGADLLGVAGGDGTQALVAGIAAQHGIPLLVISAGTRNHFALDLGLDRRTRPGAWTRCATVSSSRSTWASSGSARSSTTPRSAPTPAWSRARPTATTRPARPPSCSPGCWSATRGPAWWPGRRT
jgi:Diacylglycerol kinase catalytic domain